MNTTFVATLIPSLFTPGNGLINFRIGGTSEGQHIPLTLRRDLTDIDFAGCSELLLLPIEIGEQNNVLLSSFGSCGLSCCCCCNLLFEGSSIIVVNKALDKGGGGG